MQNTQTTLSTHFRIGDNFNSPETRWFHRIFLHFKHVDCALFCARVECNALLLRSVPTLHTTAHNSWLHHSQQSSVSLGKCDTMETVQQSHIWFSAILVVNLKKYVIC